MTVSSTTSKVSYTGNGSTTAFAVPFYFLAAADLQVILRSGTTETVQVLTTNYTVSGAGVEAGGTVTMLVAPAAAVTVTIRRNIEATQETDLLPNDRLPAESLETALDKVTMLTQQLGEESARSIKFPASDAVMSSQVPAASARASKFLSFDANGVPTATVGVDATLDIFTQAGTGATPRSVNSKLRDTISAADFGAIGDGSDETAKIQLALNSIPAAGGTVFVPAGVKFNLQQLTFPQRCNMEYYVDSDLSNPGSASDLGSGELILFSSNSSYPTDPTGAIVNEWRFTAPFHPGVVVDVRKDVTGANQWLAPGQNLTNPARASYNILDEQVSRWTNLYVNYPDNGQFSGVFAATWRTSVVISGVGTANWTVAPSTNAVVSQSNGASGVILSQTSSSTTVLWKSGRFVAGLPLTHGTSPVYTSTANVSNAVVTIETMPWLAQDFRFGSYSIGLPPQAPAGDLFAVGGRIVSTNTRSAGQYVHNTITEPGYGFINGYEESPVKGRFIICTSASDFRRLTMRNVTATTDIANVGACTAHNTTSTAGSVSTTSFNVASVTKSATGVYDVLVTNAFARDDYTVTVTTGAALDYAYVTNKGASGFTINVVQTGTSTPRDLTAVASFACFGGDY
jgi:hypothetical protein